MSTCWNEWHNTPESWLIAFSDDAMNQDRQKKADAEMARRHNPVARCACDSARLRDPEAWKMKSR